MVIFFQLGDEPTHGAEITGDEKPLQIVGSIRILLRCPRDRLPGSFLRPFEAFPMAASAAVSLPFQNTFDLALVLRTRLASASMKWKRTGSKRSAPVMRKPKRSPTRDQWP
jgi:hypothetical protein